MSANPSFAELEAQRAAAIDATATELAQLEARHRREHAGTARECEAKRSAAEAAHAAALETNERAVMQGTLLALGPLVAEFEADPKAETARAVAAKYRVLEQESFRLIGRGFNPNVGNPLAIALIKRQLSRTPDALSAFANPSSWVVGGQGLLPQLGLAYPLDRVLRAMRDPDPGRELLEAMLELVERVRKTAKLTTGPIGTGAEDAWRVICSGASAAAITAMLAELAKAAEQHRTDESVAEQAIIARARAGETIPGRTPAWHRAVRAVERFVTYAGTGIASGLNLGGGKSGSAAGL